MQRSDDGGRTWSAAVTQQLPVTGVIPVIQPDGKLVLTFWSGGTGMVSVTSTDGGVTLDEPVLISRLTPRDARPFRAPPLIAAELERAGSRADRVAGLPLPDRLRGERRRHLTVGRREDVVDARPRHLAAATSSCRRSASSPAPAGSRSRTT